MNNKKDVRPRCALARGSVSVTLNVEPGVSTETLNALGEMAKLIACRDCWNCDASVEMEPRSFTERCPHCNAYDPHGSPSPNTKVSERRGQNTHE